MGAIVDKANEVFREFEIDDVPLSGVHHVAKSEVRELMALVESAIMIDEGWASLKAAWDAAKPSGVISLKGTPGATYTLTSLADTLTATDETIFLDLRESKLVVAVNEPEFISVVGSWSDIVGITSISGDTLEVVDASNYAVNDLIKIVDETPLDFYPNGGNQGEFAIISAISDDTITIAAPVRHAFDTEETPRVGKIGSAPCHILLGEIEYTSGYSGDSVLVWIEARKNPVFRLRKQDVTRGVVCRFVSCFGPDGKIDSLQAHNTEISFGYGIVFNSSEYGVAQVTVSGTVRHAIDAGSSGPIGASSLSAYGEAYGCRGINSVNYGAPEAPFATHQGTWAFTYENCHSYGAASGVAFRGIGNRARNCTTTRATSRSFSCFRQSGDEHLTSVTDRTVFENCSAYDSSVDFGRTLWGEVLFKGGVYEVAEDANLVNGPFESENGSITLENVTIIATRGAVANRVVNGKAGTTGITIRDCTFRFQAGLAPVRIIDDPSGGGFPVKVTGLHLDNPSDTIGAFFGNIASLTAGSEYGNITITGGLTEFVEGKTQDEVQPFITGPIVVGGRTILKPVLGTYIEGVEQAAPSSPSANGYRIFAQDNGAGKTQLMVQFATGAAQQIAIEP